MKIINNIFFLSLLGLASLSYSDRVKSSDTPADSDHLISFPVCSDQQANNQDDEKSCFRGSQSLGIFMQEEKINAGIEGSIMFDHLENQASKISLGFTLREKKGILDVFRNISYTHYYHFSLNRLHLNEISPYIGLGVVFGGTMNCTDKEIENDECEENGMASIYPELGFQIRTRKLTIHPFIRRYDFNDHNTYGLSIGRNF